MKNVYCLVQGLMQLKITDAIRYVPIVTLSVQDNAKLSKL